jgi:hypothetical protein
MSETFGRVDGPFQGAKKTDLEGVAIWTTWKKFQDFLNFAPLGQVACFDAVGDEEFAIFDQAGFIRSFVNPVKSRTFFVIEVASDRFVGEEHKLLDQLVGFVGGLFFNPVGSALGIEEDTQLREIEVEGALGKAVTAKS